MWDLLLRSSDGEEILLAESWNYCEVEMMLDMVPTAALGAVVRMLPNTHYTISATLYSVPVPV